MSSLLNPHTLSKHHEARTAQSSSSTSCTLIWEHGHDGQAALVPPHLLASPGCNTLQKFFAGHSSERAQAGRVREGPHTALLILNSATAPSSTVARLLRVLRAAGSPNCHGHIESAPLDTFMLKLYMQCGLRPDQSCDAGGHCLVATFRRCGSFTLCFCSCANLGCSAVHTCRHTCRHTHTHTLALMHTHTQSRAPLARTLTQSPSHSPQMTLPNSHPHSPG